MRGTANGYLWRDSGARSYHTILFASFSLTLLFTMLFLLLSAPAQAQSSQVVEIPDPGLQAAIRDQLGKPTGDITIWDMETITHLYAGGRGIQNLEGMQFAINIRELWLMGNQISDMSALTGLASLQSLGLDNNLITTIPQITGMTNLQMLSMGNNQIFDISSLAGLTSLQSIFLQSNQISDITVLGSLSGLQYLDLSYNQLYDISGLGSLANTQVMSLQYNQISDISPLANLSSLQMLVLDHNQISTIPPVTGLSNLLYLYLNDNQITDITGLSGLPNLYQLYLQNNLISDISPLEGNSNISYLYLQNNRITDITGLAGMTSLYDLQLEANKISNILPLTDMINLFYLNLANNHLTDISALAACTDTGGCQSIGFISVERNFLDISESSSAAEVINILINRGINVSYEPQRINEAIAPMVVYSGPTGTIHSNIISANVIDPSPSSGLDASSARFTLNGENAQLCSLEGEIITCKVSNLTDSHNVVSISISDNSGNTGSASGEFDVDITPVNIPDTGLQTAIRNQIGKPTGVLTRWDMETMTTLSANFRGIQNLEGLQYARNLQTLYLYNNSLTNISPLSGLTSLHTLYLDNNHVAIDGLIGLTNLQVLSLCNNQISDISILAGLTGLRSLYLDFNQVSDISPLASLSNLALLKLDVNEIFAISQPIGLPGLKTLYMKNNMLSDISSLAGLANINTLYLDGNQISDISSLAELGTLQYLELNNNLVSSIPQLRDLTDLQSLFLGGNQISDISGLSGLPNLNYLGLDNNQITDISGLADITSLQGLYLYNNQITDISSLARLTNLNTLSAFDNQITDISILSNLPNLQQINLDNNQIANISDFTSLPQLMRLSLNNNQITDISGFTGVPNLLYLHLDNNQISNITELEGLSSLQSLYLGSNHINDISGLSDLPNIQDIDLSNNQIADISGLSELMSIKWLLMTNNQIIDISPLAGLMNIENLYVDNNQITEITALKTCVNAGGFASGAYISVEQNHLDISDSSQAKADIDLLINHGLNVTYEPQKDVVAPTLEYSGPLGTIKTSTLTITTNVSDAEPSSGLNDLSAMLTINGGAMIPCSYADGVINCDVKDLPSGYYVATISISDMAGNSGSIAGEFYVDTVIVIRDDETGGECGSIGVWDQYAKTCTVAQDIHVTSESNGIEIDSDGITLDGAAHSLVAARTDGTFLDRGFGVYLNGRTGVNLRNITISGFSEGIMLDYSDGNRIEGITLNNNSYGIHMESSRGNVIYGSYADANSQMGIYAMNSASTLLTATEASLNGNYGILVQSSPSSILTRNSAQENGQHGIYLDDSSGSTVDSCEISHNGSGGLYVSGSFTTVFNNSLDGNLDYGLSLGSAEGVVLRNNHIASSRKNFSIGGGSSLSTFDADIDTSNLVDGRPIYYIQNATDQVFDSTTNAGVFYCISCENVSIKDLTLNNNEIGVYLLNSRNSAVENVTSSNNDEGIYALDSHDNRFIGNNTNGNSHCGILIENSNRATLSRNSASSNTIGLFTVNSHNSILYGNATAFNNDSGIYLAGSDGSALSGNETSSNNIGLTMDGSPNSYVFNNSFIENMERQIAVHSAQDDTYFAQSAPTGGNYWSNYDSPEEGCSDLNGDGFCDTPYVFANWNDPSITYRDDLPLVRPYNTTTLHIRDDITGGDCEFIGAWDGISKICTVESEVTASNGTNAIEIDADNILLDGNGHSLTGSLLNAAASGYGINMNGRTGVTVRNFNITGFDTGIRLDSSNGNNITTNTITANTTGIKLTASDTNAISDNMLDGNVVAMNIDPSNNNSVTTNNFTNNQTGLIVDTSSGNTVTRNNFTNNVTHATVIGGQANLFDSNFWSGATDPGVPYAFPGGQDNDPWINQNAWLDATAPQLTNLQPVGTLGSGTLNISADFSDTGDIISEVDVASILVTLDGAPLFGCTASTSTVDCPVSGVTDNDHIYSVSIQDNAGNQSEALGSFTVNLAPVVGAISAPIAPVLLGNTIIASATISDPGMLDTHTAVFDWGDLSTSQGVVTETNGTGSVTGSHTYLDSGVYTIKVNVTDSDGASMESIYQYVVVYDPTGGFVTGGGWINSPAGAYVPNPALSGKAKFGFVSKYKKGASVPSGETEFELKTGNFEFESERYEWLVINDYKAQYRGVGEINDHGNYGFILTAVDGKLKGYNQPDTFRIKIWEIATGNVVYDNKRGSADGDEPTTTLGGGDIVIHRGGDDRHHD